MAVRAFPFRVACLLGALFAVGAGPDDPQVRVTVPGFAVGSEQYGTPQPAEVGEIAGQMYLKRAVRTKGHLDPLDFAGRYFRLSDGGSAIVLIPAGNIQHDLQSLRGHRVEVEGYVRRLVEHQGTCKLPPKGQVVPTSICDNPELPPTPDLYDESRDWPQVSVTAWYVGDISASDRRRDSSRDLIGDILDATADGGKTVRVGRTLLRGRALRRPRSAAGAKGLGPLRRRDRGVGDRQGARGQGLEAGPDLSRRHRALARGHGAGRALRFGKVPAREVGGVDSARGRERVTASLIRPAELRDPPRP